MRISRPIMTEADYLREYEAKRADLTTQPERDALDAEYQAAKAERERIARERQALYDRKQI